MGCQDRSFSHFEFVHSVIIFGRKKMEHWFDKLWIRSIHISSTIRCAKTNAASIGEQYDVFTTGKVDAEIRSFRRMFDSDFI